MPPLLLLVVLLKKQLLSSWMKNKRIRGGRVMLMVVYFGFICAVHYSCIYVYQVVVFISTCNLLRNKIEITNNIYGSNF